MDKLAKSMAGVQTQNFDSKFAIISQLAKWNVKLKSFLYLFELSTDLGLVDCPPDYFILDDRST